jgi:hypothetical protein
VAGDCCPAMSHGKTGRYGAPGTTSRRQATLR